MSGKESSEITCVALLLATAKARYDRDHTIDHFSQEPLGNILDGLLPSDMRPQEIRAATLFFLQQSIDALRKENPEKAGQAAEGLRVFLISQEE